MPSPQQIRQHNEVQRGHYDTMAASNPRMRPADSTYVRRHVERMIDFAELRHGDRILDVGCGMGKFTLPLLRRGYSVEGLDLSPELLRILRSHLSDNESLALHRADLLSPPGELLGRFDVVVGFFMLHHLVDTASAFSAVRRLLKPGGRAAFLEPNGYDPLYYLQIALTPRMSWRADRGVREMTAKRLTDALGAAGFADVRAVRRGALPPFLMNRSWGPAAEDAIDAVPFLRPVSAFQLVRGTAPAAG